VKPRIPHHLILLAAGLLLAGAHPAAGQAKPGPARAVDVALVLPAPATPGAVSFAGALPNPSHGGTTLAYALPRAATVSLNLYSISGRLVAAVGSGVKEAGAHRVVFAGRGLPAGAYFAVLAVEGQKYTRTVILR
jgi:hypothetical protein